MQRDRACPRGRARRRSSRPRSGRRFAPTTDNLHRGRSRIDRDSARSGTTVAQETQPSTLSLQPVPAADIRTQTQPCYGGGPDTRAPADADCPGSRLPPGSLRCAESHTGRRGLAAIRSDDDPDVALSGEREDGVTRHLAARAGLWVPSLQAIARSLCSWRTTSWAVRTVDSATRTVASPRRSPAGLRLLSISPSVLRERLSAASSPRRSSSVGGSHASSTTRPVRR